MTPKQKKECESKIQAALEDIREVLKKHQCIFTIDVVSTSCCISLNTDPKIQDTLKQVLEERWIGSIYQGNKCLHTMMSSEMQKTFDMQQKMESLMMVLDPTEYTKILMRMTGGENMDSILSEYEDKIQEHKRRLKEIENDPKRLLADFGDIEEGI